MSRISIEDAIPPGQAVLLDTTTLAAYLDTSEATHPVARDVVELFVGEGRNPAAISTITAMELLVRPLRAEPPRDLAVLAFLTRQPNLEIVAVDLGVAEAAARLRAAHRFSPPDALVIGTAITLGIRLLVTNDFEWARKLERTNSLLRVVTLAEHRPIE